MAEIDGQILSGSYDGTRNEFTITKIKNLYTETTLNNKQVQALHDYLANQNDVPLLTINDQLFVRFSEDELEKLRTELKEILSLNSHLR